MIANTDFECAGDALARPHPNSYWLAAGKVLAGAHPGSVGIAPILGCGVTHFIDLTGGPPGYEAHPARREAHPIVDFGIPTVTGMRRTLDAITAATDGGGRVYLHCRAGIGRTGTVAACLLVDHGYEPEAALALLQRKWQVAGQRKFAAQTPETVAQREFIAAWSRQA